MNAGRAIALSQLAEIVGQANVSRDPAQLSQYAVDQAIPSAVVRPGSAEQAAEIVKFAGHQKLALMATGARTKLDIGMPPRQYDLAVDLTGMDRVIAYDPGDLTLSVEAGIPLHKIAAALAAHRQFLPLGVPFADCATAGGTIASGIDSPLRQSYGGARDFVLGMEFVTGEGVAAKSGGRVVKNVSGYDIHKLMIGSLGTLGVITRINFRTFPGPRSVRTFLAVFREPQAACELLNTLARSVLRPRTLEIVAVGAGFDQSKSVPFSNGAWTVVASFAGDQGLLDRHRRDLESLAERAGHGLLDRFEEMNADGERSVQRFTWEFPTTMRASSPGAVIFKISALPTELLELAKGIQSIETPHATILRGVGVVYLALLPASPGESSVLSLHRECRRIFGLAGKPPWRHVTLPWCPAELKRETNVWGPARADFALMSKLKDVFDPGRILSPGRFVGGV